MTRKTFLIAFALLIGVINIVSYGWLFSQTDPSSLVEETLSFENISIRQLAFDGQGRMWILTNDDLRLYDGGELVDFFRKKDIPALNSDNQGRPIIKIDNEGNMSLANARSEVLRVYRDGDWSVIPTDFLSSAFEFDNQGRLWMGFEDELRIFDGQEWVSYTPENSDFAGGKINHIAFDAQNRAWLSTDIGISIFDGKSWEFLNSKNSELPWDYIFFIFFDDQGRAWIEVDYGISVFDGKNWIRYSPSSLGFRGGSIQNIVVDNNSWVWVVNDSGDGIRIFDGEKWRYDFAMTDFIIESITTDNNGDIWLYDELTAYKIKSELPEPVSYSSARLSFIISSGAFVYLTILLAGIWLLIKSKAEKSIIWVLAGFVIYLAWIFANVPNPLPLGPLMFGEYTPHFLVLNPGTFGTIGSIVGGILSESSNSMQKGKKSISAGKGLVVGVGVGFCFLACKIFYI